MRIRRKVDGRRPATTEIRPHRLRRPPSLSGIEVPPDRYKADLELHDRFTQFSSELLRMAVGGVAAIGFFVSLLAQKERLPTVLSRTSVYVPLAVSVAAFVLAGGGALAHRFLAADGMFHHLRAIKHLLLIEKDPERPSLRRRCRSIIVAARADELRRSLKFKSSERMLFISGALLFVAVGALGGAVVAIVLEPSADMTPLHRVTSPAE